MPVPCYWGVTDLKISDCKDCYAKLGCARAGEFMRAAEKKTDLSHGDGHS